MVSNIQPIGRHIAEYRFAPTASAAPSSNVKVSSRGMRRIAFGGSAQLLVPLWRPFLFQNTSARKKIIKKLLHQLNRGKKGARLKAALALGTLKAKEAVNNLMSAFKKETHPKVREAIIKAIGQIGDHAAAPVLAMALEDQDEEVGGEAYLVLIKFGNDLLKRKFPKPKTEDYLGALSDKNMLVRYAAASALAEGQGDSRVLKKLHHVALKDKSAAVRSGAVKTLASLLEERSLSTIVKCLEDKSAAVRIEAANAITLQGARRALCGKRTKAPKVARLLVSMAKNRKENTVARYYAAWALQYWGDLKAVPVLIGFLNSKVEKFERAAANSLGGFKDKRAVKALIAYAKNPRKETYIRVSAIESLGKIGNCKAVPTVVAFLKNKVVRLVLASAMALAKLKDRRAVKPLMRALNHGHAGVRNCAAKALGVQGDGRAVRPLAKLAGGKATHVIVKESAIVALGRIGGRKAVRALRKLLPMKPWTLFRRAAKILGELKNKRSVMPLIVMLKHKQWQVRYHAALSLGEIGDRRAIKPLLKLLKDKNLKVRQAAAGALLLFNDKKVNAILRKTGYLY